MTWSIAWPGGRPTAVTFSFDDGHRSDARMVAVLDAHGLRATFNLNSGHLALPGKGDGIRRDEVATLFRGHEVATHGVTHSHLTLIQPTQLAWEVQQDRRALEALVGEPIVGHAYSFGAHDEAVARTLAGIGIAYARTVHSTTYFDLPSDWLRWHPTCHHSQLDAAIARWRGSRHGQCLYVWSHSWELDEAGWSTFEGQCAEIAREPGFWPATNRAVQDYAIDWGRLQFAADLSRVRNPTGRTLWMHRVRRPDEVVEIPPGAVVALPVWDWRAW